MNVLDRIVARKRLENARRARFAERIRAQITAPRFAIDDVHRALRRTDRVRVIAEIKLASPSAGTIREREPGLVTWLARAYEAGGAAAISVLADRPGFAGSPLDVRRVAHGAHVPVLFKEFVVAPLQLDLARVTGASMVLLIVRALDDAELTTLVDRALDADLVPVVEAADASELERALATNATVIGVNARDLRTFEVDRAGAITLASGIPADRIAVVMSGIKAREHVEALGRCDAILVGEHLVRSADPESALRALLA